MGKGDFRDIPAFEHDLDFLMDKCKPSSINIHQMHQTEYTSEKMMKLIKIVRNAIVKHKDYECINSNLNDDDVFNDTVPLPVIVNISTICILKYFLSWLSSLESSLCPSDL